MPFYRYDRPGRCGWTGARIIYPDIGCLGIGSLLFSGSKKPAPQLRNGFVCRTCFLLSAAFVRGALYGARVTR